ncbi:hypothetical protein H5410_025306 [Solanum commersonii]|uniref:Uncharacterized protein n=1 Tax=Solanum commersonii TaxID=4109 RepID=A0A9J5YY54_SOLCO|nr:hypothetical protein H5410_025306 [Solanum commersonii]
MREFLLLCEHLDTYPKENSNLKGNVNPNKVAGDVPLAPCVPKHLEGKSRAIIEASTLKEGTSSSSAKAERIISGKPESKTNQVPSGTKVFSSFQVGKQHPKEEEYLAFTIYVYNLSRRKWRNIWCFKNNKLEDPVKILETEEDHRGYALKATFDGEIFRKIEGLKLNLKTEDNLLKIEKVIEITQTTGKHKLNLLTKPMIDQILRKIPEKKRKKMNYVHLGGIQILVKSTFKEGINCPIVINLSDERFINAREGNLGIVEGNLAYTKLLFTYYPKYCISLKDVDFNDALSLHFQIKRNDLFKPGNHIISIYYQALYIVTNSNYGKQELLKHKFNKAQISDEYEIQFGQTQEIGSTSNPRLSIEYGRNSIRKSISNRYPLRVLKTTNITKIKGRIFNGIEWKYQEILIQTGATANHVKSILLDGISIYEGKQYTYKTFEGNNFSCKNMVDLPIQLDTIRITVSCYITNHESDQDLILGNLFLNKLEDYSIGKNGIEMIYKDNKSQRLFKIRDELSKLFEQARILQFEINQLSATQAENMREFLILCVHLDIYQKYNSKLKGNVNPNKAAGDVPLVSSAQNISKVSTDMPIPISKDEEKSRVIIEASTSKEGTSSSSAKSERIISGKSESKTNQVPSGTKVYVYNLPEESGETFGVLGTTSLFPRISIFPNGIPSFTAQLFDFGCLDRVYAKQDLKELSQLPIKLFNAVKNYVQRDGVYCRFYSIAMECKDLQAYYLTLNYVSVEKIKDFNVKATGVDKKLPHLNKKWIQTRRDLGIKALYFILKRFYNEDCRIPNQDQDWVLITKGGKSKSKELKERILDIELHRLGATKETWTLSCKMLDHNHPEAE